EVRCFVTSLDNRLHDRVIGNNFVSALNRRRNSQTNLRISTGNLVFLGGQELQEVNGCVWSLRANRITITATEYVVGIACATINCGEGEPTEVGTNALATAAVGLGGAG